MKKIAVYGSLRRSLGNHSLISNSQFLGEFKTPPEYSLYSLGGFPGLKKEGQTSITMEVYEVDDETASRVDTLEGYSEGRPATFYDKEDIETPWGTASVYIYVPEVRPNSFVESGDWREFMEERRNKVATSIF